MTLLQAQNLHASYAQGRHAQPILHGIELHIAPGESFGLIGPSGCGKSTLLRVIAGLHAHWHGELHVDGVAIQPGHYPQAAMRQRVQMVFQDPYASLHPRHRVERALLEVLQVNRIPNAQARLREALREVGLPAGIEQAYPHQMSGGQRQRVAIARALLLQPKLLLLDEPTSALDVSVQAGILNLLNALKARTGMSLLLVSHDAGVIGHMCDRAARMHEGRVVELLEREALAQLA